MAPGEAMKRTILSAAKRILIRNGLAEWTIEDVAVEAGCAKGLVNYHYKTKVRLLTQVAESLRNDRLDRRVSALRNEGAAALDSLWNGLVTEVHTGELAAWLALSATLDPFINRAIRSPTETIIELGRAAAHTLGITDPNLGQLLETVLTGFQIALLHGHDETIVREAYHRFWLGLL